MMSEAFPTPGVVLPGGILLVDEPAHASVTTFKSKGEVLLGFITRPGADIDQIIIGLSANQALELIRRLSVHADVMRDAVTAGNGGAVFPEGDEAS